ncbi:hypothetical protein LRP88_14677 [Fusarium phalaenopsidis]
MHSARFFSAAEDQLSAEKGAIRLTSIQARLAQCLYLLSHSRLNHCWSLFGTTAHLMLALGIHRKSRVDASSHPDYVDLECRKRTFWCAYNLDTYLSAALGRPRTFHDDDIDQELPLCVDDNRLARGQPAPSPLGTTQSIMSGSIAHIKLSRIVAKILRDLYGIRQPSTESQYKLAAKYAKEIDNWHSGISYLVDTDGIDPSLFQPIFLRQRNVLNLACWHAQILVHRPFLLNNFASLANLGTTRNSRSRQNSELTHEHVQRCLEAAMNIVAKIDDLHSNGLLYNTFWITSIAIPGSLGQRYGVVLQELRVELLRHNTNLLDLGSTDGQGAASGSASMRNGEEGLLGSYTNQDILDLGPQGIGFAPGAEDITDQLGLARQDGLGFSEHSPGSSIVQMTGWGQFESLVTGGVGGIEAFLDGHMGGWNLGMGEQLDT